MNWAIIEPESRIFKGNALFRWEDSPGLEHHCGICAKPLHNARAGSTCLGKHVEPCYRFHQQLHFVGKSHECHGCNNSDRMHYTRHKEILKIVRLIKSCDNEKLVIPGANAGLGTERGESLSMASTSTASNVSWDTWSTGEVKSTKRARKTAKKIGKVGAKGKYDSAVLPIGELDFISQAIHGRIHESKGAWKGTYSYGRTQNEEDQTSVISEDVGDAGAESDPLSVKPPAVRTPRQRKVRKTFSAERGGSRKFTPPSTNNSDPYDGVNPQIFFHLGIAVTHSRQSSKGRKVLITRLVAAIKADLEIIARENQESAMRKEGFSRWAGSKALEQMRRTREELDWATGQKRGLPSDDYDTNEEEVAEHMDRDPLSDMAELSRNPLGTLTHLNQNKEDIPSRPASKLPRITIEAAPKNIGGALIVQQVEDNNQDGWSASAKGPKKQTKKK